MDLSALQGLARTQVHTPSHSGHAPRRRLHAACSHRPGSSAEDSSTLPSRQPALPQRRTREAGRQLPATAPRALTSKQSEKDSGSSSGDKVAKAADAAHDYVEGADGGGEEDSGQAQLLAKLAPVGLVLGLAVLAGSSYVFKDQIRGFIDYFIDLVDGMGPIGYVAYGVVYTALEVLALPAVPLTMTAGAIFGVVGGTAVVSVSSVLAATIAFLIARYAARERVQKLAAKSPKFKAIDKVIGKNGLKVVTLLRLSPLLPLALSNYLYGLTSVDLPSYVLGSWAGMLPGTIAYVTAGDYGMALLEEGQHGKGVAGWQVGVGLAVTGLALAYIGRLASQAIEEQEADAKAERDSHGKKNGAG